LTQRLAVGEVVQLMPADDWADVHPVEVVEVVPAFMRVRVRMRDGREMFVSPARLMRPSAADAAV
jgi:hypothetical protein